MQWQLLACLYARVCMCVYVQLFVYVPCASLLDVNQNTGQLEIFTNGRHWKIDVLCDNIWSFGWVAYNRQTTVIIIICYVVFIAFNINHSSILPLMALNSLYYADVPLSNYSLTHPLSVDCGQLSCLIRCRTLESKWMTDCHLWRGRAAVFTELCCPV